MDLKSTESNTKHNLGESPSKILTLPWELRSKIFEDLFRDQVLNLRLPNKSGKPCTTLNVLLVNR
jgi:hypothetical protein